MADVVASGIEFRGQGAEGPAGVRSVARRKSRSDEHQARSAVPQPRSGLRRLDEFARERGLRSCRRRGRAFGLKDHRLQQSREAT